MAGARECKRWRFCLSDKDFLAMEYLKVKYSCTSWAHALRMSLKFQVERDQADTGPDAEFYERLRQSVTGLLGKARRYGVDEVSLNQWSCWFFPVDFTNSDLVRERWGLRHRSEAIRFALRAQAEVDGFYPEGGVW